MQALKEADLSRYIEDEKNVVCEFIACKDREFDVAVHVDDRTYQLMSFRGKPRRFADVRRGFDWAKRLGIREVQIKIDLKRWQLD